MIVGNYLGDIAIGVVASLAIGALLIRFALGVGNGLSQSMRT